MAAPVVVRVSGLSQTVRALIDMGVEVDDLKDAMAKIAALAARTISAHAPVKSGRLQADVRGNRARSRAVVTAGRASIPYAGPINYGWKSRNIAPANFMQSADQQMPVLAPAILEAEVNKLIRRNGLG